VDVTDGGWGSGPVLGYAVVRLAHVLGRRMERDLAPLGLTPTGFSALFQLAARPDVSAAALARAILITPQSVGPLLDGLAAAGLVTRERSGPRGAIRTQLTGAGRERLAEAVAVVRRLDEELCARLPGVDHARLAALVGAAADGGWPS
jgi:DNA-binding MarR family transcriptional regulator